LRLFNVDLQKSNGLLLLIDLVKVTVQLLFDLLKVAYLTLFDAHKFLHTKIGIGFGLLNQLDNILVDFGQQSHQTTDIIYESLIFF
jgi:hypothetical protein